MKYIAPVEARNRIGNLKYLEQLRNLARRQRNNSTLGEIIFWQKIKNDRLGYRFLRQKPVGRFIVDFYCSKLLLAIEIDGDSHLKKKGSDIGRDEYLLQRGIITIRYKNEDILKMPERIIIKLKTLIISREKELSLSSKGECPTTGRTRGI
jgi:very-short-patch-repair endonuclease